MSYALFGSDNSIRGPFASAELAIDAGEALIDAWVLANPADGATKVFNQGGTAVGVLTTPSVTVPDERGFLVQFARPSVAPYYQAIAMSPLS